VLQLVVERTRLGRVDEVAVLRAPPRDGVGHPVDDLLERVLPLGRSELTAEVLLGDDVRGVLRPRHRELDVELLEGDGAVAEVRDARVAPLPGHLVVGVGPVGGEVPADADACLLGSDRHETCCLHWVRISVGMGSGASCSYRACRTLLGLPTLPEPQDVVGTQGSSHEMRANYSTVITCPSTDDQR